MPRVHDAHDPLLRETHHSAKQPQTMLANLHLSNVLSRQLIVNRSGLTRACDFKMENILNTRYLSYRPYLNRCMPPKTRLRRLRLLWLITDFLQDQVCRGRWPDQGGLLPPKNIHHKIIFKPARRSRSAKPKKKARNIVCFLKRKICGMGSSCLIFETKGIL